MTIYYVNSVAGSNTSPYDTWAKGATTLGAAVSLATNADIIYVASDHNETPGTAAKTFTFPSTPGLLVMSVDRTSGAPPATYTPGAEVTIGAGNVAMNFGGFASINGINFRGATNNSASCLMNIGTAANPCGLRFKDCTIESQTANASGFIHIGPTSGSTTDDAFFSFVGCTFEFNNAGQKFIIYNAAISCIDLRLAGTAPTTLFRPTAAACTKLDVQASNLAGVSWTNLAEWVASAGPSRLSFISCRFPSGYSRFTGTPPSGPGGPELLIHDCSTGDTHGEFAFESAQGSCVASSSVYWTAGPATQSWRITTNANCTPQNQFVTPWIDFYNDTLSSQTPYINVLRFGDSSTTAYDNDEVWGEFTAKTVSGYPTSTFHSDAAAELATPAAQATSGSTSDWTGDSGSCWFGKVDSGASITPAEVGYMRGRVCVGIEIAGHLYADPCIRT